MSRIKASVYGFYAGNDARIDATIPDAVANMKASGKTYEPVTYEGAGHGFMRAGETPDDPNPAQPESPRRCLGPLEIATRQITSARIALAPKGQHAGAIP